jgi:mono/diheme cytochrome c family protein
MSQQSANLMRCWTRIGLTVATLCLSLMPTAVSRAADGLPDATRGLAIAMKTCAGCHLIGDGRASTASASVPTFRVIANRKNQSAERIISALVLPHPPMPDTHLTREEVMDIVAYLDTLRDRQSGKPSLLPDTKPKKLPPRRRAPS